MPAALPLGTIRYRDRWEIKKSYHGTERNKWRPLAREVMQAHHLKPGDCVYIRDPSQPITAENLYVGKPIDNLKRILKSDPRLQAKQKRNQSKVASRTAKRRNVLRARIQRSRTISLRQFYPVIHATQKIIFQPFRTKKQAVIAGGRPEYAGMAIEAVRGSSLETLVGYEREIPNDGQSWVQKRTRDKLILKGDVPSAD